MFNQVEATLQTAVGYIIRSCNQDKPVHNNLQLISCLQVLYVHQHQQHLYNKKNTKNSKTIEVNRTMRSFKKSYAYLMNELIDRIILKYIYYKYIINNEATNEITGFPVQPRYIDTSTVSHKLAGLVKIYFNEFSTFLSSIKHQGHCPICYFQRGTHN